MAWDIDMVIMLRAFLNDWEETNFTDHRLKQLLVIAANYVKTDILELENTYTITIASPSISPDPSSTSTRDDVFMNFTVLKAACIADMGVLRTKALLSGIKARCGPAVLETVGHLDGFKTLIEHGPCATYELLKQQHNFSGTSHIFAIMSPFVSNNFDPQDSL